MTIKQKVARLVQAVASYERTDLQLQNLPATGYFRRYEPEAEIARVPYRDALGTARDRAQAEIKAASAAIIDGDDDGTDEREAIWQAGYTAAGEDVRVLLRDIKRRLDDDAEDEYDRTHMVSEQTKDLTKRVEGALHDDE